MPNRLSFLIEPFDDSALAVTPCIDGVRLSDMVATFSFDREQYVEAIRQLNVAGFTDGRSMGLT